MKKYKVILFDLDGTLTEPAEGIINCVIFALEHMGIHEENREGLKKFIGPPLDDSFMEYYGMDYDTAWKAVEKYRERFNTVGKYENRVYDGIPEVLKMLKDTGRVVAMATSKPEPQALDIMNKFKLAQYFDEMTGSDYEGTRHEKYQVILEALKRLGVEEKDYNKVLMVGDRKYDIIGAKLAGVDSIGVRYGYAQENELEESGADYIVDTVADLYNWLLENQGL